MIHQAVRCIVLSQVRSRIKYKSLVFSAGAPRSIKACHCRQMKEPFEEFNLTVCRCNRRAARMIDVFHIEMTNILIRGEKKTQLHCEAHGTRMPGVRNYVCVCVHCS